MATRFGPILIVGGLVATAIVLMRPDKLQPVKPPQAAAPDAVYTSGTRIITSSVSGELTGNWVILNAYTGADGEVIYELRSDHDENNPEAPFRARQSDLVLILNEIQAEGGQVSVAA